MESIAFPLDLNVWEIPISTRDANADKVSWIPWLRYHHHVLSRHQGLICRICTVQSWLPQTIQRGPWKREIKSHHLHPSQIRVHHPWPPLNFTDVLRSQGYSTRALGISEGRWSRNTYKFISMQDHPFDGCDNWNWGSHKEKCDH